METPLLPTLRYTLLALAGLALIASARAADGEPGRAAPLVLEPLAKLAPGPARENSGLVASRRHPGLFWMINDSGDAPRVYGVRLDGTVEGASRAAAAAPQDQYEAPGVLIGGAINVDWEDLALDTEGRLLIPDFGNNANDRRDLVIYVVDEPRLGAGRTTWRERWFMRYPEQTAFPAPPEDFNYDAEALFTVGATAHVLTKRRSDRLTSLYRLAEPRGDRINDLELVEQFDIGGLVTAADASADGLRLLVATYDALWVFERASLDAPFFGGSARRVAIDAPQVEAACFLDAQGTQILLADERTALLYQVALADLAWVDAADMTRRRREVAP